MALDLSDFHFRREFLYTITLVGICHQLNCKIDFSMKRAGGKEGYGHIKEKHENY